MDKFHIGFLWWNETKDRIIKDFFSLFQLKYFLNTWRKKKKVGMCAENAFYMGKKNK